MAPQFDPECAYFKICSDEPSGSRARGSSWWALLRKYWNRVQGGGSMAGKQSSERRHSGARFWSLIYAKGSGRGYHQCAKTIKICANREIFAGLCHLPLYLGGRVAKLLVEAGAEVRRAVEPDLISYFGHRTSIPSQQLVSPLQSHIPDELGGGEVRKSRDFALKLTTTERDQARKFINAESLVPHLCLDHLDNPPQQSVIKR